MKKAQRESRDKVPAGGFIDHGKYLSILSSLLSENVAKIAPINDRFKHLQEILETIHKWLEQPANATNVSMFPFPQLPSPPPPSGPPPPAPAHHLNHHFRFSNPLSNNNLNNNPAIHHQYQIPHQTVNAVNAAACTPIYAVSSVIHNNSNPNVKNISQVQMNCTSNNNPPPYPLQLQIPSHANVNMNVNPTTQFSNNNINNPRSGSQASSGYQSQSPVLEGSDDKAKKASTHIKDQINAHINNINMRATEMQDATTALTFNNPVFNTKVGRIGGGSQSVDDLSTVGVDKNNEEMSGYPRRLARSSSSSDCEYSHSSKISPMKGHCSSGSRQVARAKGQNKTGHQHHHHRLSRRSSAELLRKNHPYSSSSDEDSDSGLVNDHHHRDEDPPTPHPHLPPRRREHHQKKVQRSFPDGGNSNTSSMGDKSLEEYEREMSELRRAMEALQVKLNRAEERLFGNESPSQNQRLSRELGGSDRDSLGGKGAGPTQDNRYSRGSDDGSGGGGGMGVGGAVGGVKEVDQLLQRLLSAEEEMKREHDLLTALDKKQKLIEAQEEKVIEFKSPTHFSH